MLSRSSGQLPILTDDCSVADHIFGMDVCQIGDDNYIGVPARGNATKEVVKTKVLRGVERSHLEHGQRVKAEANRLLDDLFHIAAVLKAPRSGSVARQRDQPEVDVFVLDPSYFIQFRPHLTLSHHGVYA